MALLKALCWALILILRIRFPPGTSIATVLNSLIEDNQKSPVFSVSGKFFARELFLVARYLYVFQINHKPSVPHMGATKRNNFGQRPTVY